MAPLTTVEPILYAELVELADTLDSKLSSKECGFKSPVVTSVHEFWTERCART